MATWTASAAGGLAHQLDVLLVLALEPWEKFE